MGNTSCGNSSTKSDEEETFWTHEFCYDRTFPRRKVVIIDAHLLEKIYIHTQAVLEEYIFDIGERENAAADINDAIRREIEWADAEL